MVGIASAIKFGQELLGVVHMLRQFFGTWSSYQRHQTDIVLSETNTCGAVLVTADTEWDSGVEWTNITMHD